MQLSQFLQTRIITVCMAVTAVTALSACVAVKPGSMPTPVPTHGVAVGDITHSRATVWSRTNRAALMQVRVEPWQDSEQGVQTLVRVDETSDFTGKVTLDTLSPGTEYLYRVWFEPEDNRQYAASVIGRFRTPPTPSGKDPVRFAWSADLAGQNICRDANEGFPIFHAIARARPDLFIGGGDMIYADGVCREQSRYKTPQIAGNYTKSTQLSDFWAHWRYTRADRAFQNLLASTVYIPIWDDHEVVNNFGPHHDTRDKPPYTRGVHLMPIGLRAFLDYNPLHETPLTPGRLFRRLRWGQHLELFVLDTRQYRDPNSTNDSKSRPKTMLGADQLAWLKQGLAASDATWKVLVSSVPLTIPTAFSPNRHPDAWANGNYPSGFEQELLDIMRFLHKKGIRNSVWLSGDVHFATALRLRPIPEDPAFTSYEFVAGPLHARATGTTRLDPTLRPQRLFFYAPENFREVTTNYENRRWLNFGLGEIDHDGNLTMSIRNVDGELVYSLKLTPK